MPATRKVVGLWLCFYAPIGLLRRRLQERIFVVLQEATTSIPFWSYRKDASN
jgi:hypothetical protein